MAAFDYSTVAELFPTRSEVPLARRATTGAHGTRMIRQSLRRHL
jgi:hypothetical protein